MRPNSPACKDVKILLGVYVLGGLRGQQETRVRTHLAHCARCRAEHEELAELPALLDMITSEEAAEAGRLAGPAGVPGGGAQGPDAQADAAGDETGAQAGDAANEEPAAPRPWPVTPASRRTWPAAVRLPHQRSAR
jgi:anti-sigma factor ChrR (cupin superfamily)